MTSIDSLQMERRQKHEEAQERAQALTRVIEIEQQDLVWCSESFDCPICFVEIEAGEGIMLRDCLHLFCRYQQGWF